MSYAEPADLFSWMGIPGDAGQKSMIATTVLTAASRRVDRICGRTFTPQSFSNPVEYTFNQPISAHLLLLKRDLYNLVKIEEAGADVPLGHALAETFASTDGFPIRGFYRVEEGGQRAMWRSPVKVTGLWGWEHVPEGVRQATLMLGARLYRRAFSPLGIVSSGDAEQVYADSSVMVPRWDSDIMDLIRDYCVGRVY